MNIVFMGTPEFAVASLKVLIENNHKISAVVTTPDKQRGRGQKITFTAVKEFALQNNIPVIQPDKLKEEGFISYLKNLNADLFVVVAFRILPREVFSIPPKGTFNLHGSLLPKYRGAAPIQWALINGENETGVTTFFLDDKVDTGSMILQEKIKIDDEDDFGSLHDKLSVLGAGAVLQTVNLIERGNIELKKQNNSLASLAPKITKEISEINWNLSAEKIHNLVRGLSPHPVAFFHHKGKIIKVFKTKLSVVGKLIPGEIKQTKDNLFVGCGDSSIEIIELQLEGKKRLKANEFLRGFSFS
ncbi:MAG TPA: methionyl-tRNA formyltransferase [Ignavibacteriaceae bacterium]|nr:methionyl-tRNA formyltransferase [Ignavibacteriaceae bacterium]